jgi:hypothetical protein
MKSAGSDASAGGPGTQRVAAFLLSLGAADAKKVIGHLFPVAFLDLVEKFLPHDRYVPRSADTDLDRITVDSGDSDFDVISDDNRFVRFAG